MVDSICRPLSVRSCVERGRWQVPVLGAGSPPSDETRWPSSIYNFQFSISISIELNWNWKLKRQVAGGRVMGAGSPSSDETRWPSFSNACHSLHSLQLPACFNPNSKLTDSINCTTCSGFRCYFGPKCHLLHPIIHIGQAHNKFPTCIQNLEGETQCIFCQCQYKALLFTHRK